MTDNSFENLKKIMMDWSKERKYFIGGKYKDFMKAQAEFERIEQEWKALQNEAIRNIPALAEAIPKLPLEKFLTQFLKHEDFNARAQILNNKLNAFKARIQNYLTYKEAIAKVEANARELRKKKIDELKKNIVDLLKKRGLNEELITILHQEDDSSVALVKKLEQLERTVKSLGENEFSINLEKLQQALCLLDKNEFDDALNNDEIQKNHRLFYMYREIQFIMTLIPQGFVSLLTPFFFINLIPLSFSILFSIGCGAFLPALGICIAIAVGIVISAIIFALPFIGVIMIYELKKDSLTLLVGEEDDNQVKWEAIYQGATWLDGRPEQEFEDQDEKIDQWDTIHERKAYRISGNASKLCFFDSAKKEKVSQQMTKVLMEKHKEALAVQHEEFIKAVELEVTGQLPYSPKNAMT